MALTVVPLVVSALRLIFVVSDRYYGFGDIATSEMYIRDIGDHVLLIGPYSRDGWYHPGPAFFYLFVVPYRLLGSASINLPLGALLVNGVSVVAMALLARRRGGLPLMLATLVACSLLMNAMGPEFLSTPWNPYVVVLPYGVLLFLAWSMLCGDTWALPIATFVASFLAQTHIAYVALAAPLYAAGVAGLVLPPLLRALRARRSGGDDPAPAAGLRPLVRPGLVAVAVGVVMWLPPVIEQLTHEPGNLGEVAEYFRSNDDDAEIHSLGDGWRVVSAQYGLPPEWLAGRADITYVAEPEYLYSPLLPVLLVPVLGAAVLLWRRGGPAARWLIALWAGASCVGIVASARTIGPMFFYRLGFTWVLGMIGGLLVLWAGWQAAVGRWGGKATRALVAAAVVVLAGLAVFNSASTRGADAIDQDGSWALADLAPAVRDWLPEREGVVVVGARSFGALGYGAGLRLDLERHGIVAEVPVGDERQGRRRTYESGPVRARLVVAVDAEVAEELEAQELQLIAYSGRLSQDEVIEAADRKAQLDRARLAGEISDEEHLEQVAEVFPPDSVVAVFAEPSIAH